MQIEDIMERRTAVHNKFHTLLETRTETLALYNQLAAMRPFKPEHDIQMLLQEFCESLVDYTASAHFQLYSYIEAGNERREVVKEIADDVYPKISSMTKAILDFNEKYDCEDHCDNLSRLDEDLSKLGEILADRIQEEDKIINVLSQGRK